MMTREQFMDALKAALEGMQEEEREGVLSYYNEMIDDRMEAGMTEEAAVKAMEPVREIASRVLEEAGIAPEKEKQPDQDNRQEIRRPADTVRELRVQAENKRVRVEAGEEEEIILRYTIGSNDIYRLHEDDGVLTLEHKTRPMSSFINEKGGDGLSLEGILSGVGSLIKNLGDFITSGSVFGGDPTANEIEVTLPKTMLARLTVGTSNGSVSVEDVTFAQTLNLHTSNGAIKLEDVNCAQKILCATSNSRITLDDVNVSAARLTTSNGRVTLDDVYAREDVEVVNSNGGIVVEESTVDGLLRLTTSNGRVELDAAAAARINIKTSNGGVTGTIKGSREDYTITSSTTNGANQLGNREGGEKELRVVTSNGAITLDFEE